MTVPTTELRGTRLPGQGDGLPSAARQRGPSAGHLTVVLALVAWALLIVVARIWGLAVVDAADESLHLGAIPFFGEWDPALSWRLVPVVALGVGLVGALPLAATRLGWRGVLSTVAVATVAWSLALAFVDPPGDVWRNIENDYATHTGAVDELGGPGAFLDGYVAFQSEAPTHLQAHPPGLLLGLWGLEQVGVSGEGLHVALAMAGSATAAVAALVALRDVAGRGWARRAAPFVVLAPAAIWHTNADVVFAGVGLLGVALVVVATGRADRRGDLAAAAGGLLLGAALMLSYGLTLLAVPVVVVAAARRRLRPLLVAGTFAASVGLLPLVWGFWWWDGLEATRTQYDLNLARVRPYGYFLVANLAVFAVAVGPATAAGLARLRDRAVWLVVGGGLGMVALADLSGLSSAETERIWQPFVPLVLLAGAAAAGGAEHRSARPGLGAQVVVATVLVIFLRSPW